MSSAPVTVRALRYPDDLPAVLALWQTAGAGIQLRRSDQPEELEKKLARDPDLFLVAERESVIIGAVLGGYDGRRGMVYHLAVDPGLRRQGIATLLMDELESRLRAKGCIKAYLLVTRGNEAAMRLYEERGWEHMDLFVYGKDLA